MRILVCGGRDFNDYLAVEDVLEGYLTRVEEGIRWPDDESFHIIHGGANGADYLAKDWAYMNHIPCTVYPANWDRYKKVAGVIRNQQMIDYGHPDLVIAFPGGNGTADMVKRAIKAGIEVREIT